MDIRITTRRGVLQHPTGRIQTPAAILTNICRSNNFGTIKRAEIDDKLPDLVSSPRYFFIDPWEDHLTCRPDFEKNLRLLPSDQRKVLSGIVHASESELHIIGKVYNQFLVRHAGISQEDILASWPFNTARTLANWGRAPRLVAAGLISNFSASDLVGSIHGGFLDIIDPNLSQTIAAFRHIRRTEKQIIMPDTPSEQISLNYHNMLLRLGFEKKFGFPPDMEESTIFDAYMLHAAHINALLEGIRRNPSRADEISEAAAIVPPASTIFFNQSQRTLIERTERFADPFADFGLIPTGNRLILSQIAVSTAQSFLLKLAMERPANKLLDLSFQTLDPYRSQELYDRYLTAPAETLNTFLEIQRKSLESYIAKAVEARLAEEITEDTKSAIKDLSVKISARIKLLWSIENKIKGGREVLDVLAARIVFDEPNLKPDNIIDREERRAELMAQNEVLENRLTDLTADKPKLDAKLSGLKSKERNLEANMTSSASFSERQKKQIENTKKQIIKAEKETDEANRETDEVTNELMQTKESLDSLNRNYSKILDLISIFEGVLREWAQQHNWEEITKQYNYYLDSRAKKTRYEAVHFTFSSVICWGQLPIEAVPLGIRQNNTAKGRFFINPYEDYISWQDLQLRIREIPQDELADRHRSSLEEIFEYSPDKIRDKNISYLRRENVSSIIDAAPITSREKACVRRALDNIANVDYFLVAPNIKSEIVTAVDDGIITNQDAEILLPLLDTRHIETSPVTMEVQIQSQGMYDQATSIKGQASHFLYKAGANFPVEDTFSKLRADARGRVYTLEYAGIRRDTLGQYSPFGIIGPYESIPADEKKQITAIDAVFASRGDNAVNCSRIMTFENGNERNINLYAPVQNGALLHAKIAAAGHVKDRTKVGTLAAAHSIDLAQITKGLKQKEIDQLESRGKSSFEQILGENMTRQRKEALEAAVGCIHEFIFPKALLLERLGIRDEKIFYIRLAKNLIDINILNRHLQELSLTVAYNPGDIRNILFVFKKNPEFIAFVLNGLADKNLNVGDTSISTKDDFSFIKLELRGHHRIESSHDFLNISNWPSHKENNNREPIQETKLEIHARHVGLPLLSNIASFLSDKGIITKLSISYAQRGGHIGIFMQLPKHYIQHKMNKLKNDLRCKIKEIIDVE